MPIYENAGDQSFPQKSSPGGVDPGKKIYSTSLKDDFVSKVYSTYKGVNGNPGCSSH